MCTMQRVNAVVQQGESRGAPPATRHGAQRTTTLHCTTVALHQHCTALHNYGKAYWGVCSPTHIRIRACTPCSTRT